jgi:hypothetical protein
MTTNDPKMDRSSWEALPRAELLVAMESEKVWAVPSDMFRGTVEELMHSDAERAGKILTNLAEQVEHPEPEVRGPSAKLMAEMGDLYVMSYEEVLDAAILHVETQLEEETEEKLQELLTDTFLDLRKLAAHSVPIKMGEARIACANNCGEEEMLPIHRPATGPAQTYIARLYCYQCSTVTKWTSEQPERRDPPNFGKPAKTQVEEEDNDESKPNERYRSDRRRSERSRSRLPIRVRREDEPLGEAEIGTTINTSKTGVMFISSRAFEPDERVAVVLPYEEGDFHSEARARVVRLESKDGQYHVALHYLL